MFRRILILSVTLLFLAGCQTLPQHRVHQRVLDNESLLTVGRDTLILPLHIEVKEMSVAGLSDVVPHWTRQAKQNLNQILNAKSKHLIAGHKLIRLPELDAEKEAILLEHTSLAKEVWLSSQTLTQFGGLAWSHKAKKYDYTIGPGLNFLVEQTGAKKALLIIGEDVHTTAGRKAMSFVAAALFGVAIPLGHKILGAVLVDLPTGDILWSNLYLDAGAGSLLNKDDVNISIETLFEKYPDIDAYRKFAQAK
jgi:hypothetical protein